MELLKASQIRKVVRAGKAGTTALVSLCLLAGGAIGVRGAGAGVTLAVAGRSNANVSLAANGAFVVAVWSASVANGVTDIFAAVSPDGGTRFSSPVRVNSTAGEASVNGEQPPRATLVSRSGARRGSPGLKLGPTNTASAAGAASTTSAVGAPDIVVVWTAKGTAGTTILTARSIDGGRTFGRTTHVPGSDAAGNRGWEALASDARGRVGTVWLDHRALAMAGDQMAEMHHETSHPAQGEAPKEDGVAKAQQSKLYFALLDEPSSSHAITGGVCYCCKTALAMGPGNVVAMAWRHVYPGNIRDIAFTLSRDGGRTFALPIRVSEDKWELEGCPDDGPAMVIDAQEAAHVVWPTMVREGGTQTIALFQATSRDGKSFSPRVRVPTEGLPHHPQVALASNGSLALAWDELLGGKRRVVFAQDRTGAGLVRQVLSGGESADYPVMAATPAGVLTAWASGAPETSVIRLERR
jgi:hypothetical protein